MYIPKAEAARKTPRRPPEEGGRRRRRQAAPTPIETRTDHDAGKKIRKAPRPSPAEERCNKAEALAPPPTEAVRLRRRGSARESSVKEAAEEKD